MGTQKAKSKDQLKILIVDDHHITRDMVRMILKGLGFSTIVSVDNAFVAAEEHRTGRFDLIICDWNMPRCSGLEFLRQVRSDSSSRLSKTPFIMLTAEAYRDSLKEAVKAGVTDYIVKPFTADVLQKKIYTLFGYTD